MLWNIYRLVLRNIPNGLRRMIRFCREYHKYLYCYCIIFRLLKCIMLIFLLTKAVTNEPRIIRYQEQFFNLLDRVERPFFKLFLLIIEKNMVRSAFSSNTGWLWNNRESGLSFPFHVTQLYDSPLLYFVLGTPLSLRLRLHNSFNFTFQECKVQAVFTQIFTGYGKQQISPIQLSSTPLFHCCTSQSQVYFNDKQNIF